MQFTDGIAATTPPKQIPTVTTPEALFSMSSSPRTQVTQREATPAGTVTVDMVNAMRREQEVNLLPLLSDVGGQTVDAKPNIRIFVATSPDGEAQTFFRAPSDIAQGQIDKAKFIQMWTKYLAKFNIAFNDVFPLGREAIHANVDRVGSRDVFVGTFTIEVAAGYVASVVHALRIPSSGFHAYVLDAPPPGFVFAEGVVNLPSNAMVVVPKKIGKDLMLQSEVISTLAKQLGRNVHIAVAYDRANYPNCVQYIFYVTPEQRVIIDGDGGLAVYGDKKLPVLDYSEPAVAAGPQRRCVRAMPSPA